MDNNFSSMPKIVNEGRRVINNIKNSASLYLMKTLFTTIFAILSIALQNPYPFATKNLLLIEMTIIGIPSFFLSLQPNNNIVTGKFISYVFSRALPGAIILVASVMCMNLAKLLEANLLTNVFDFKNHYEQLATIIITLAGLIMLYRVCQPFNVYRSFMYCAMLILSVFALIFVPQLKNDMFASSWTRLPWQILITITCVIQFLIPVSKGLLKISDKILGIPDIKKKIR
jgi:cation-transporting ATPase E